MATVYLNASTGNDSNTYAQAQNPATPWLTVAKVVSGATTGDSVIMAAGTYTWANAAFTGKTFSFTGASPVSGFPVTILDGAGAGVGWIHGTLTLSNLMFQNSVNPSNSVLFGGFNPTIMTLSMSNCIIRNCTIPNSSEGGVIGSPFGGGIVATLNNVLIYNIVSAVGSSGVYFNIRTAGSSYSFTNTVCYAGAGVQPAALFNYTAAGILTIKNSILAASSALAWKTGAASPTVATTYSTFYNLTSSPSGTGILTGDPLFTDPALGNFNLRPTSPCLDTGSL